MARRRTTNFDWSTYRAYLTDQRIATGIKITIELTFLSMVIGVLLGIVLAVMRLSPNPVLRSTAWVYLWIFRGTPVYVQLVFWGLFGSLYPHIALGIPFVHQFVHFDMQSVYSPFVFAFIGLGLNEAAYMAEIVRAGVSSVGEGQSEAATALGMSWAKTMRRVVLPQAMRVIIPPTGNEVISMLKTTSLVTAVPLTHRPVLAGPPDLRGDFKPIPLLLVASTWYLIITSILMVGQYFLEKHYARGRLAEDVRPASCARWPRRRPTCPRPVADDRSPPMVEARGVRKNFGALKVLRASTSTVAARAGDVPGRAVRLGQVDLPALHQPSGAGQRRPALRRRRPGRLRGARGQAARAAPASRGPAAARHRHGLPALQPVPAHDGAREHHRGAGPGEGNEEGRGHRHRPAAAGPGRAGREGATRIRRSSRAVSSSGSRSPGRSRWSPS